MSVTQVLDPGELRRVFGAFPTGVTAVAALLDGEPIGMAASSFTPVSLDPPLVSVCIARASRTWRTLVVAPRLGISVLSAGQEVAGRRLSARVGNRFDGLSWRATPDGAVLLDGAAAWLDCSLYAQHRAGDHDIVVLRVHDLDADQAIGPLVFHASRFRRLEG